MKIVRSLVGVVAVMLLCTPAPVLGEGYFAVDTPKAIPSNGRQVVSTLRVTYGPASIESLSISLDLAHAHRGEVSVDLVSPQGYGVNIFHRYAGDPDPDLLLESESVTAFDGLDPRGVWRLIITDNTPGNDGTLLGWALSVNGESSYPDEDPGFVFLDHSNDPKATRVLSFAATSGQAVGFLDVARTARGNFVSATRAGIVDSETGVVTIVEFLPDGRPKALTTSAGDSFTFVWRKDGNVVVTGKLADGSVIRGSQTALDEYQQHGFAELNTALKGANTARIASAFARDAALAAPQSWQQQLATAVALTCKAVGIAAGIVTAATAGTPVLATLAVVSVVAGAADIILFAFESDGSIANYVSEGSSLLLLVDQLAPLGPKSQALVKNGRAIVKLTSKLATFSGLALAACDYIASELARPPIPVQPVGLSLAQSGGPQERRVNWFVGRGKGKIRIDYNFFSIADTIEVLYGGVPIFQNQSLANSSTIELPFGPGNSALVEVVINKGGSNQPSTEWSYSLTVLP